MQLERLLEGHLDPDLSGHVHLASIEADRAVLVTSSAARATRLRLHAPDLAETLRQAGFPHVARIDVRVAPLTDPSQPVRRRRSLSPAARKALELMGRLKTGDGD